MPDAPYVRETGPPAGWSCACARRPTPHGRVVDTAMVRGRIGVSMRTLQEDFSGVGTTVTISSEIVACISQRSGWSRSSAGPRRGYDNCRDRLFIGLQRHFVLQSLLQEGVRLFAERSRAPVALRFRPTGAALFSKTVGAGSSLLNQEIAERRCSMRALGLVHRWSSGARPTAFRTSSTRPPAALSAPCRLHASQISMRPWRPRQRRFRHGKILRMPSELKPVARCARQSTRSPRSWRGC